MKHFAVYFFTLIYFLLSFQHARAQSANSNFLEYFGADHNEAEFTIEGKLIVKQLKAPTKDQVDPLIRKQMRFMLGLMRSRSAFAAALYPKFTYNISSVSLTSAGTYTIKYSLKAKGLFSPNLLEYTFTIPINPQTLFANSLEKCMDSEEANEVNFWYHWEPKKSGCPLVENVHYYNFKTKLNRLNNTVETFPEYAKLVDNQKQIKMTMFFGFSNYDYPTWNPNAKSEDWGIKGYNQQRDFLKQLGFVESVWNKEQVDKIYKAKDKFVPYVIEMKLAGANATIRIRMVLAESGLYHNSLGFHTFLREALSQESVIVYDGHSGLGKNLDLAAIEKMRTFKFVMNPNYQIIFLGSCVPYAYYTDMFFARKKSAKDINGTLALDIFSYGKEAVFGNKEDIELTKALVKYATQGTKLSFQQIIRNSPNYFFGINGDEDNPKLK